MLRHSVRALGLILQPRTFSMEVDRFKKKSAQQILRLSTKSCDPIILNKISELGNDELKNISSSDWLNRINILRYYGFSDSECQQMIEKHPEILETPAEDFESSLKQWSCSNLEIRDFRNVIFENPIYLDIEYSVIRKRLPHLLSIFGSSTLVSDLLINNPCVMFDDWDVVLKKCNYLMRVRGFKAGDIVKSCSLSRSLDLIKFRFDLLEKCGIYKQMTLYAHKINKYDRSQHKNPTLHNIVHPDNEFFSLKVAKISLEEYDVCYDLFIAEQNEEIMDSDDDDDEYDKR